MLILSLPFYHLPLIKLKNKGMLDLLPEHTYCNTVIELMVCTIKDGLK